MALRLDATDRLSTAANALAGPVSASFWVQPVGALGAYRLLWGIGGNTSLLADAYALWMNASGLLELYGPGATLFLTTGAMTVGQWTFVALAGSAAPSQAWSVWVGGTEYTGTSPSLNAYAAGPVDLGGTPNDSTGTLDGRVTAYKHWSARLTGAEVQAERWTYLPQRWADLWSCAPLLHTGSLRDYSTAGNGFTATGTLVTEDGPALAWAPGMPWQWGTGLPPVTGITGTSSVTQAEQTLNSSAVLPLVGTSALTQAAQTGTSASVLALQATTTLTQAVQTLAATGQSTPAITGTVALTQAAQTSSSTAALALQATTTLTQAAQSLTGLGAHEGPLVQGRWPFGALLATTIPGTVHGLGTPNLFVQVYDAGIPASQLQAQVTIHPTSYDVQVQFGAPTAGAVLLSAMTQPAAGKAFLVADGASWSFPASEHGRGSGPLFVQLFDASGLNFEAPIQVTATTGDVLVTLPAARDGRIVVVAPSSAPTPANSATAFSSTSVTVSAATHGRGSAHLLVAVYNAATPATLLDVPITVNPSTQAVTATFLVTQAGTLIIGGGAAVGTGAVSVTQGAQTSSSTGTLALTATVALTQAAQTVTSTGTLPLQATLPLAQAAQTCSSTGALRVQGTSSVTQAAQTLTSAGVLPLTGTSALTQAAQTVSSIGGSQALGLVGLTQAAQTLTSAGTLPLTGTSALTQAAQTLVSTGFMLRLGSAALTQAVQTLVSTGVVPLTGTSSLTQGAQTLTSTGALRLAATTSLTQATQTGTSAGAVVLQGSAALTQAAQSMTSASVLGLAGSVTVSQASQTSTSAGALRVAGSGTVTQAAQTLSSTGTLVIGASVTVLQAAQTLVSTAVVPLRATVALSQADQTGTSTGVLPLAGGVAVTQEAQSLSSTSFLINPASGAALLTQAVQSSVATGRLQLVGMATVSQEAQSLDATGALRLVGTAIVSQEAQSLAATAILVFGGTAIVSQAPQTLASQGAIALAATGLLVQAAQTVVAEGMSIPMPEVVRGAQGTLTHATASAMGLRRTGLGQTPILR